MTDQPEPEQAAPIAALVSALASGTGTQQDHDRLLLKLIEAAQARGATWEQIARVLQVPNGKAARKRAHQLEAELRQSGDRTLAGD